MTTASESMPLADYLVSMGVEPGKAAVLGAEGKQISDNRGFHLQVGDGGRPVEVHPGVPAPPPARLPVATPTQVQEALTAHQNAQLEGHLDQAFAAPASASDYRFPASLDPETPEAEAADAELRTALHAEGLPKFWVESVGKTLAEVAATRMNETPEQAQARIASTRATLERWYGRETDANLALVDGFIDRLLAKGGATRDFVEAIAPHLDALSLDGLVQIAKHRAGRR